MQRACFATLMVTILLLRLSMAGWAACSSCTGPKAAGPAIQASGTQTAMIVGVNKTVYFSITASDTDICGDPYPVSDAPLVYYWSGATGTGSSASASWATPGTYQVSCTVDDDGLCGNDGPATVNFTVIVTENPDPPVDPPPPTGNGEDGSDQGCDESSGGGCSSSCGGSEGFPSPSMREKTVYYDLAQAAGGLAGPGADGSNSGPNGFKRNVLQTLDSQGRYVDYWDGSGKTNRITFPPSTWQASLEGGAYVTKNRSGSIWDGTFTVNTPNGSQEKFNGWYSSPAGPVQVTDATGLTTTFNRNSITGAVESVTTPTGETWTYGHTSGDAKITSVTAPDGTYIETAYVQSGYGIGKPDFVKVWADSSKTGDPLSQITYTYNEDDKVEMVTKGSRVALYLWDTDKITVTEVGTSPQINAEYLYGSSTTTITRKHPTDSNLDQSTEYTFYTDGGKKTYVYQVTDPLGKAITYDTYTSGTLKGNVYQVTDALGRQTDYEYNNNPAGTLKKVTYPEVGGTRHTIEYTYYGDTIWTKTVKDVRGDYTYYDRDPNALQNILSIKVSAPINGQAPTDQQWASIDPIRQYEYYGQSDPNGLPGQLKRDIVPDIDGCVSKLRKKGRLKKDWNTGMIMRGLCRIHS